MTIPDSILDLDLVKIGIYIYIKRKCGSKTECEITMSELAAKFDLKRPTASKYLHQLIDLGVLFKVCQHRDTSVTLISLKNKELDSASCQHRDTSVTLEDRKKAFVEKLKPYLEKYGKDTLNNFYQYWTQVNEGGTKMLWEKQKAFQIPNRLATWHKNNYKDSKSSSLPVGMNLQGSKDKDYEKGLERWNK